MIKAETIGYILFKLNQWFPSQVYAAIDDPVGGDFYFNVFGWKILKGDYLR